MFPADQKFNVATRRVVQLRLRIYVGLDDCGQQQDWLPPGKMECERWNVKDGM